MNNLVTIVNGEATVTSRQVADNFWKRHGHVIDSIEKHMKHLSSTDSSVQCFYEAKYWDTTGKINKEFIMNRDGVSLLNMGFQGAKALYVIIEIDNSLISI
ncbi:MAG: putative antirepressor [Firmicutes bacterium]|nr:putative antirepressor [Bacillota bacterium]